MPDEINSVTISVEVEDNTAAGLQALESNVSSSASQIGQAFDNKAGGGALAGSEGVGRFDRALRNATDSSNLGAKAVSRLVRMFNPFNIGIGLAISGIVALGKSIMDAVNGPMERIHESMRQTIKDSEDLRKSLSEQLMTDLEKAEGLSAYELKKKKLGHDLSMLEEEKARLEDKIRDDEQSIFSDEEKLKWSSKRLQGLFAEDDEWVKINAEINKTVDLIEEVKRTQEALAMSEAVGAPASGASTITGKKEKKGSGKEFHGDILPDLGKFLQKEWKQIGKDYDTFMQGKIDSFNTWFDYQVEKAGEEISLEEATNQLLAEMDKDLLQDQIEENKAAQDQMLKDKRDAARLEIELQQERLSYIDAIGGALLTSVDIAGKVAAANVKSEKAKQKAEATTAVIMSSINAAIETAKAIASYPNIPAMIAHAAAAAAFIAAAALAAKYSGTGVQKISGSAGAGGSDREAFGPPSTGEDMGRTTIIIQGHVFSPEGGADFVRRAMEASEDQRNPGRTRTEVR